MGKLAEVGQIGVFGTCNTVFVVIVYKCAVVEERPRDAVRAMYLEKSSISALGTEMSNKGLQIPNNDPSCVVAMLVVW